MNVTQVMSLTEFASMLDDVTTTIVCHPTEEEKVRDLLVASTPRGAYRVTPDETQVPGRVNVIRPARTLEWSP